MIVQLRVTSAHHRLADGKRRQGISCFERAARLKLEPSEAAVALTILPSFARQPYGSLKVTGRQYASRINDQWRIWL